MIPDKIKIGGIVYDVKFVDCVDVADHNIFGTISHPRQEILIKNQAQPDYTNQIFLHELVHGIFQHCGLEQDESVIDRIAFCLYQVLKDNKIKFGEGDTGEEEGLNLNNRRKA